MATTPPAVPEVPPVPAVPVPDEAQRLKDELARKTAENDALRRRLETPARPTPVNTGRETPPPKTAAELTREFFEKPLDMSQSIAAVTVNNALAQRDAMTYETLKGVAREQARAKNPSLFDQFAGEITAMVEQAPVEFHQNATVWANAFKNVVGDKQLAGQIRPQNGEGGGRAPGVISRSPDGPAPPSPAPPPASGGPASRLTAEQREMARTLAPHFGWDHDKAEERYAHGLYVHENQGDGRHKSPSSWSKVITMNNIHGKSNRETPANEGRR